MASIISASTTSATALNLSGDTTGILQLATGATPTTAVTIDASQNVGISTTPVYKLDINGITGWGANQTAPIANIVGANAPTNGGGNVRVLSNTSATADAGGSLVLGGYYTAQTSSIDFAEISGRKQTSQTTGGYLAFATRADLGNETERMRIDSSGNVLVTNPAGLGYGTGSGGTVTQATSKGTAVTLNKPTGQIVMNNAALAAGATVTFQINNSLLSYSSIPIVSMIATGNYIAAVRFSSLGYFYVNVTNITAGSLSEAPTLGFVILSGATA